MTAPSMTGITPDAAGALAMRWLTSVLDALDSGVLHVAADVSDEQCREIERELWLLRRYRLAQMHAALGTAPDQIATIHLRRYDAPQAHLGSAAGSGESSAPVIAAASQTRNGGAA